MQGYKTLITYQLARIAFDLTWDIVYWLYPGYEDSRQRDQLKQASRSLKQGIVEGSEERSLGSKLKLHDVARSSLGELLEDYEDFLRLKNLRRWNKNDHRLVSLRREIEGYSSRPGSSVSSCSPSFSKITKEIVLRVLEVPDRTRRTREEEQEIVINYLIDVLIRCGYLLDKQINALEEKHQREGGYNEKLFRKRKEYRGY